MTNDKGVQSDYISRAFRKTDSSLLAHPQRAGIEYASRTSGAARDLEGLRLVQESRRLKAGEASNPVWLALYR